MSAAPASVLIVVAGADPCQHCAAPMKRTKRVDPADEFSFCEHCDRGHSPATCAVCRSLEFPPEMRMLDMGGLR